MIIAFTGLPRAGKDTAAQYLVDTRNFIRRQFADPLKHAAAILLNRNRWEMDGDHGFDREAILPEWGFSTRDFLQRFGTEVMRDNFGADFWVKHMRNRLQPWPGRNYVITDCRFENEAALVRELGGVVIRIVREGCVRSAHVSDADISYDGQLVNNSTRDHLGTQIEMMLLGLDARAEAARRPAPVQS